MPLLTIEESVSDRIFSRFRVWARLFMLAQVIVVLLLSVGLWVYQGHKAGYSAVLGGVSVILPSFYFARRVFARTGAQSINKIVQAFYVGEAVKLVLTMGLCFFVFTFIPVVMLAFFAGFMVAQAAIFLVPFIHFKKL